MKKINLFILVVIVTIFVSGCTQQQTQAPEKQADKPPAAPEQPSAEPENPAAAPEQPPAAPEQPAPVNTPVVDKASVEIKEFAFNPQSLTIKPGTTVVWTNMDSAPHTIKSDAFNSGTLRRGETFEFKFERIGTYDYICGVHPSMKGKIIVE